MELSKFTIYILGAFIRYYLMTSKYQKIIENRVEVTTPINSWKKVTEGLHLHKSGLNPYIGDFLHEQPINMFVYNILVKSFGQHLHLLFILCDLLTAYLLKLAVDKYLRHFKVEEEKQLQDKHKIHSDIDTENPPLYVAGLYLFNPYTIFNCVGFTTTTFANVFIALFFYGMTHGRILLCAFSVAVCTSHSLYPVMLASPLFLTRLKYSSISKAIFSLLSVAICLVALSILSYFAIDSWSFLNDTYGFILAVPDLRPNMGLFWYFFIEMFEHFRPLFIYAFQMNVSLLYLIPLSICFRRDPMILATNLLCLIATFKSYPCIGDFGLVLALLPCWKHLFNYVQQGFLVTGAFMVATALAPTVWHLWIYNGSANANFYFGVTLAFATAEIFLITDILFAYIKREFTLKSDSMPIVNGDEAQLVLE